MNRCCTEFFETLSGTGPLASIFLARMDVSGRHYQICRLCGTAYEYDWRMMCQNGRLMVGGVQRG